MQGGGGGALERCQYHVHLLAEFVAFGMNGRISVNVLLLADAAVYQFLGQLD